MLFNKKYLNPETLFFYGFLVISLINVWAVNVYSTIDGPAHLYNAGLLNLFDGNSFLNEYFQKNDLFLPNYFSHILLSNLFLFFDPFTSEKIFLSFLVLFMPLSFRLVIKLYTKNTLYSFLIFPLVFSFLMHVGFFNFCAAFIFFNCQLALLFFFLKENKKWHHLVLFVLNSIILFNAHAFVFVASLIVVFLITIVYFRADFKVLFKKLMFLLLLFLPAIILFSVFYFKYPIPNYDYTTTDYEKFSNIVGFSPAIVFSKETDGINTGIIFAVLFFLANAVFFKRFVFASEKKTINYTDVFLALSIILVPIVLYTNSGWLSAMLSERLLFMFFYFMVFWIAFNALEFKSLYFISAIVIFNSFYNLSSIRNKVLIQLSAHAEKIIATSEYIKEKSTVFSVDYSDSWLEPHFSNYLGVNKAVVNLDNYEAVLGWFPLKWKDKKYVAVSWEATLSNKHNRLPDYIFIYGNLSKINNVENLKFKQFIDSNTVKRYESNDKYCCLYEVTKK